MNPIEWMVKMSFSLHFQRHIMEGARTYTTVAMNLNEVARYYQKNNACVSIKSTSKTKLFDWSDWLSWLITPLIILRLPLLLILVSFFASFSSASSSSFLLRDERASGWSERQTKQKFQTTVHVNRYIINAITVMTICNVLLMCDIVNVARAHLYMWVSECVCTRVCVLTLWLSGSQTASMLVGWYFLLGSTCTRGREQEFT